MVAALSDSRQEIADRIGASKTLVTYLANGDRRPGGDHIASLASEYGIPPSAWDEEPAARALVPTPPDMTALAEQTGDATSKALYRMIQEGLASLENDPDLDIIKKAEALKKLCDATVSLAKSTGENALTMQRIAAHPEFQRVVKLIVGAIEPHPEVLAKVLRVLEEAG